MHAEVAGGWQSPIYAPRPESVPAVRHCAADAAAAIGLSGNAAATVALLVSELATNAVRHAGTPFAVGYELRGHAVRWSVIDGSPEEPVLSSEGFPAEGGRGLQLVEALATRWGADPVEGDGKRVWFEVPRER